MEKEGKCEEEGGDVTRGRGEGLKGKGLQMTRSKATKAAKKRLASIRGRAVRREGGLVVSRTGGKNGRRYTRRGGQMPGGRRERRGATRERPQPSDVHTAGPRHAMRPPLAIRDSTYRRLELRESGGRVQAPG